MTKERVKRSKRYQFRLPSEMAVDVDGVVETAFSGRVTQFWKEAAANYLFFKKYREGKASELVAECKRLGLRHKDLLRAGLLKEVD